VGNGIVTRALITGTTDASAFGWSKIRRYHNIDFTSDCIVQFHNLQGQRKKLASNIAKQAEQIRFCLMLAKEYFDAGSSVTLATRPTLYYYSVMYLAMAELLLKQTGESNLELARETHRHHGLVAAIDTAVKPSLPLRSSAEMLRARPMINEKDQSRMGTFDLWHRTARGLPIVGIWSNQKLQTESIKPVFNPEDERLPFVGKTGMSLLDCVVLLPCMEDCLATDGLQSKLVRATCSATTQADDFFAFKTIVHPTPSNVLSSFLDRVRLSPSAYECLSYQEMSEGIIYEVKFAPPASVDMRMPLGFCVSPKETRFASVEVPLNEFGLFYFAMFICGTYARYYPDKWIKDIEFASPLCLAIDALVAGFQKRVAILALSEMQRVLFVEA
jgi:hypothetical protein